MYTRRFVTYLGSNNLDELGLTTKNKANERFDFQKLEEYWQMSATEKGDRTNCLDMLENGRVSKITGWVFQVSGKPSKLGFPPSEVEKPPVLHPKKRTQMNLNH